MREGRSPQQIGRKGLSNHRWIVGGKRCLLLNQWGVIVGWACTTANDADNTFQWLIRQVDGRMMVLSQSSIFGQNPKIWCQEFNDLQTPKLSKKQLCDRTRSKPLGILPPHGFLHPLVV